MSLEGRVSKLEQGSSGDEPSVIYVSWDEEENIPDDEIILLNNGVRMSYAEVKRRYPNMEQYELVWEDVDEMKLVRKKEKSDIEDMLDDLDL